MSSSRFGNSSLHQRDPRNALFENYNPGGDRPRTGSASPGGYGYNGAANAGLNGYGNGNSNGHGQGQGQAAYRPATPNRRGQYSDAVLNELESQNDDQVSGILLKVKSLKGMTEAIGLEIRESSALAEKMNDSFDNTRVRLKGTMKRMLRMAERTGVGWKVWVAFFAAVILLFWWVWLF